MSRRAIQTFKDLPVYRDAFEFQQLIFEQTRSWPREERYSLIDQVRRSSRSIGANISEAWAKRRYKAHFVSKLTDSDAELQETHHWLDTAHACGYLNKRAFDELLLKLSSIGNQLGAIITRADEFCL